MLCLLSESALACSGWEGGHLPPGNLDREDLSPASLPGGEGPVCGGYSGGGGRHSRRTELGSQPVWVAESVLRVPPFVPFHGGNPHPLVGGVTPSPQALREEMWCRTRDGREASR